MSEFSDLLSLFIKTRDVNVSALTAYCELDRSTMYKLINGKRSPSSKALVKKLASFMNLNPTGLSPLQSRMGNLLQPEKCAGIPVKFCRC